MINMNRKNPCDVCKYKHCRVESEIQIGAMQVMKNGEVLCGATLLI